MNLRKLRNSLCFFKASIENYACFLFIMLITIRSYAVEIRSAIALAIAIGKPARF